MGHPSHAILCFVVIVATAVALLILFQVWGIMRRGELKREYPLAPLTRAKNPLAFWGIVGTGILGTTIIVCVVAAAMFLLMAP